MANKNQQPERGASPSNRSLERGLELLRAFGPGATLLGNGDRDPLGTALLLGMGGVTAELFKDTTMRLLCADAPFSRDDALEMIHELKTWPLLNGYRGRPRADVDALVSAMVAFARMALRLGERIVEAEINPLFVLPAGLGVRAADGVAVLASTAVE